MPSACKQAMKLFKKKNARLGQIRTLFQLLGLQLNDEKIKKIDQSFPGFETEADLTQALLLSKDALDLLAPRVFNLHLYLVHQARLKMIRTLLPSANQILDLGCV